MCNILLNSFTWIKYDGKNVGFINVAIIYVSMKTNLYFGISVAGQGWKLKTQSSTFFISSIWLVIIIFKW